MSGRVSIQRGVGSITLVLAQWQSANTATLTLDEADDLAARILAAVSSSHTPQPSALPDIL